MRWYIASRGQTQGPFEEHYVVEMLRADPTAHVRGEAGGAWLAAAQSPFAGYLYPPPGVPAQPGPQVQPRPKPEPTFTGAQWLLMIGAVLLWIVSAATSWFGVALGLGVIGWTIQRHRKGQRSLVGIAFKKSGALGTAAATVGLGLLFSTCGANSAYSAHQAAVKTEQAAASTRAEIQRQVEQQKALLQQMPDKIKGWQSALATALEAANGTDTSDATRQTTAVQDEINVYSKMVGTPTPVELAGISAAASAQAQSLKARDDLVDSVNQVGVEVQHAKKYIQQQDWVDADQAFNEALIALQRVQSSPESLKPYIPTDFDPAKKNAEITRMRQSIAGPVAQVLAKQQRDEKKREADAAKQAAYAAVCGESPVVSGWDGAVVGLESKLKETANDPGSIDVSHCTAPVLSEGACWIFSCDVRGKNGFGALILLHKAFSFSKVAGFQEVTGAE